MRFMMLVIPKGYVKADVSDRPTAEMVGKMAKYNEELRKSGALLSLDGLEPHAAGQRVSFSNGKATVKDGPFAEAKEAVGGYWIIQVKSREEAIAWASRAPMQDGDTIEVRRIFEMSDFPPDVQKAAQSA